MFLDLANCKAFDTVDHTFLFSKLMYRYYEFQGASNDLSCICDYLAGQQQRMFNGYTFIVSLVACVYLSMFWLCIIS